MTTFAGIYDFTTPQPFNVELCAEEAPCQPDSAPLLGPALPVVDQVITPEPNLYPRQRHGVVRKR